MSVWTLVPKVTSKKTKPANSAVNTAKNVPAKKIASNANPILPLILRINALRNAQFRLIWGKMGPAYPALKIVFPVKMAILVRNAKTLSF